MALRDYQEEALELTATAFFDRGHSRLLGVLPTGTGKTVVAASLMQHRRFAQWLPQFPASHRKLMMVAHREELLTQAQAKIRHYNPTLRVEIEQAGHYADPSADVVIASIQTLAAGTGNRLRRFDIDQFRCLIIDEAHHATAPSYLQLVHRFGFAPHPEDMRKRPDHLKHTDRDEALAWQRQQLAEWDRRSKPERLLLGITATPKRGDRVGLERVFQSIAFEQNILEMVQRGYLAKLRAYRISSEVNIDKVRVKAGDFDLGQLAKAIDTIHRNRAIVAAWKRLAKGRKTIVFCADVAHARDLAKEFTSRGIDAAAVAGDDSSKQRHVTFQDFHHGRIDVLTNCNIATEGYDEPNVQCVIIARPTKSSLLYVQMAGRGTRLAPGKPDCLILDVVDVTKRHHIMTAPTLLGLPAELVVTGDIEEGHKRIEEIKEEHPLLDVTGAKSLDDIKLRAEEVDIFTPFNAPEITANSPLAWMKIDPEDGGYVVAFPGPIVRETLVIDRTQGGWHAYLYAYDENEVVVPPQPSLSQAFSATDEWLRANRPFAYDTLNRSAKWRNAMATDVQKAIIKRMGIPVPQHKVNGLRRGEASDLIALKTYRKQKTDEPNSR